MLRGHVNKFNRGEVDNIALARDDVEKVKNTAAYMNNFMPARLGPMTYRQGSEYIGVIPNEAHMAPFVAAIDDVALLEFSNNTIRVWVNDELISRSAVTTSVTNGAFTSDLTGWTDTSGAGSSSAWETGGYARLTGNGTTAGAIYQTLTTETGVENSITVVISVAPVIFSIGTGGDGSFDIFSGTLEPGTHSFAFTPTSNVTLTFSNSELYSALVDSVTVDGAGILTLPTEVTTAMLPSLRYAQSADIYYCAVNGAHQFKVERRGKKSWSVVKYLAKDGPFGSLNDSNMTLKASSLNGNATLTASDDYFTDDNIGQLFKLGSSGQNVEASVTVEDTGTNSIRVTGAENLREFRLIITGSWSGTVTLQRSTDDSSWDDKKTYSNNVNVTYDDNLDNAELYYRLWVKTGNFTSGTIGLELAYSGGSIEGVSRITSVVSPTVANSQVLKDFGKTKATRDWYPGSWKEGSYPSSVEFYEGRIWWGGKNKVWGSVSDSYTSFDRDIEGNSSSIVKTIGFGPVDVVKWLASSSRLIMGIASDEIAIRSSSFGEILTQDNANLKSGSNQGAADNIPLKIDDKVYFVQRSTIKIFEMAYNLSSDVHEGVDIMTLNPSICKEGIKRIVFARQPETRLHVVMNDGTERVYLAENAEDVRAWSRLSTDGFIDDTVVLPSVNEDKVYRIVTRTGGRYLEKAAMTNESKGGNISKHFDSFVQYSSPGTTISGLSHLEGKTVAVWADGQGRGTFVVSSGSITVGSPWVDVIVGLPYVADYTSNKLGGAFTAALGSGLQSVLGLYKRIVNVGLVLSDYRVGSLQIGSDQSLLYDLPLIEDGTDIVPNTTIDYDEIAFEFDGEDEVDPRIHIRATGPCTIQALLYDIKDPRPPKSPTG